jgi:hypothetical protein
MLCGTNRHICCLLAVDCYGCWRDRDVLTGPFRLLGLNNNFVVCTDVYCFVLLCVLRAARHIAIVLTLTAFVLSIAGVAQHDWAVVRAGNDSRATIIYEFGLVHACTGDSGDSCCVSKLIFHSYVRLSRRSGIKICCSFFKNSINR